MDLESSLKARQNIYAFLGRVFEKEIDDDFLRALISNKEAFFKSSLDSSINPIIREGARELYNYLSELDEGKLEKVKLELAADYASLFLGVLHASEGVGIIHPSESAYLTGFLYQEPRDEVRKLYLDNGLVKSPQFKEPEDHIALELYFMAHLCRKALRALKSRKTEELSSNLETQMEFLEKHLLKWAPKLMDDVIRYAETAFYRGVGKIAKGLLETDKDQIEKLARSIEAFHNNDSFLDHRGRRQVENWKKTR